MNHIAHYTIMLYLMNDSQWKLKIENNPDFLAEKKTGNMTLNRKDIIHLIIILLKAVPWNCMLLFHRQTVIMLPNKF